MANRQQATGGAMTISTAILRAQGYRLTTAEILYRFPDHPNLLQTYVWQDWDLLPKLPILSRFLAYWRDSLDGELHSVTVATAGLAQPVEFAFVDRAFVLN